MVDLKNFFQPDEASATHSFHTSSHRLLRFCLLKAS